MDLAAIVYEAQARISGFVEGLGLPLAILAWVLVAAAAGGLGWWLRGRRPGPGERRAALVVGLMALGSHIQDIGFTLAVTPDLAIEANPIWRTVLTHAGLRVAIAYGLSGKLLLSLLSWQLFTLYFVQRRGLYPGAECASGFGAFWHAYGAGAGVRRLVAWVNLFAFVFPLAAPLMLYVSVLNGADAPWLLRMLPPWPLACVAWVAGSAAAWAWVTWRAWRAEVPTR
jgi:hypothetical protein